MIACFAVALLVSWLVISPYLVERSAVASADMGRIPLEDQRARCIQVLKDLELDYSTQKISQDDYESSRLALSAELAGILEKLDR